MTALSELMEVLEMYNTILKQSVTAFILLLSCGAFSEERATAMQWIRLSGEKDGFVRGQDGAAFVPWGFNYDHDEEGRLLEDYWADEWAKVEQDFREMKELGANVVRIHLQYGKIMSGIDEPNQESLGRLGRLLKLAEDQGLYLDITGLGCYHRQDVPDWYDGLDEKQRWAAQGRFWEAVAKCCADSPAVFCYDLMNEPVVAGGKRGDGEWLGPAFAGKHFVQFVTLDQAGRERTEIAREWTGYLGRAIRKHDKRHLVTVGLVPWSLDRAGLTSGFVPEEIRDELDFFSVHIYPERSKVSEALATLKGFSVGKPVVIEEIFPLRCSAEELGQFIEASRTTAAGWIGFYWGKTMEECRQSGTIGDAMTLGWLELFQTKAEMIKR